jgi:hypothetical protein
MILGLQNTQDKSMHQDICYHRFSVSPEGYRFHVDFFKNGLDENEEDGTFFVKDLNFNEQIFRFHATNQKFMLAQTHQVQMMKSWRLNHYFPSGNEHDFQNLENLLNKPRIDSLYCCVSVPLDLTVSSEFNCWVSTKFTIKRLYLDDCLNYNHILAQMGKEIGRYLAMFLEVETSMNLHQGLLYLKAILCNNAFKFLKLLERLIVFVMSADDIAESERCALATLHPSFEQFLMDDGTFEDNPIQIVKGHVLRV